MSRFEINPDTREPYPQGMPDQTPQFSPTLVQAVVDEPADVYHPGERKGQGQDNRGHDEIRGYVPGE
jgi:hypothetical protein